MQNIRRDIYELAISWDYRKCLIKMLELADRGVYYYNRGELAWELETSERTVSRRISYLRDNNYIHQIKGGIKGGIIQKSFILNPKQITAKPNKNQWDKRERLGLTYKSIKLTPSCLLRIDYLIPFSLHSKGISASAFCQEMFMKNKVDGNMLDSLRSMTERQKPQLTPIEKDIISIARTYETMALERKKKAVFSLPSLSRGIDCLKSSRNWTHFEKVRTLCAEYDIIPQLWLEAQFDMALTNPNIKDNDGIPYPNMLHGEWAEKKFLWFLEKTENLGDDGGTYVDMKINLNEVWEGPLNLAAKLDSLLKQGEYINYNTVCVIISALPGMFEPEYICLHPVIGKELSQCFPFKIDCKVVRQTIEKGGTAYSEVLESTYRRSLERVRKIYPDTYERIVEWL